MISQTLGSRKLPVNFTGGVIISSYGNGLFDYVLVLFKDGQVKDYLPDLDSFYANEEFPKCIEKWICKRCHDAIYADTKGIVTEEDYESILGSKACGRLRLNMDCVI